MNLTTKQIEDKFDITRQTLHNWIKEGILPAPKKDFRNWYSWTTEDVNNIQNIILKKVEEHNGIKAKTDSFLKIENRRYLGSKQKMLNFIEKVVDENTTGIEVIADIFGGTGVVSDIFRKRGKKIIINDILSSNYISFNTWFGTEQIDYNKVRDIIGELNELQPTEDNYVSKNFGDKYFSNENARKIGAIREKIESYDINNREKAFLLTSLLYAMDKVANTVGHYDAFRKKMDSFNPIHLKIPENNFNNSGNEIYKTDANELVKNIKADLVYIDTPYNSRQYGDAYHLLENIIDWNQPELTGVALKMVDRAHIKSNYSTSKAPEAFKELIENINSKYILVSYNNMAKKGNGRSNAKISNEEIITILSEKGKVQVFETPFKVFTTGKTNIEDHKELLYLCEVFTKNKKKNPSSSVHQSAINYTGGKFKLIPQLAPHFPKQINNFYDVFAGGANVSINVEANKFYINDSSSKVIDLYQFLQKENYSDLVNQIEEVIKKYGLSNTKKYGYEYYNASSSSGLKNINKDAYLKLRADYNDGKFNEETEPLIFYILVVYAFNNQIRFNRNGEFNMPPGKRDFNSRMSLKLKNFMIELKKRDIIFSAFDFRDFLKKQTFCENDFVYLDPPYLISTAAYNESNGWTLKDEGDLLMCLEELDKKGVKFALSNVMLHKGNKNEILEVWSKKFKIHKLNFNYNNSNYQSSAKSNDTVEVLITNF